MPLLNTRKQKKAVKVTFSNGLLLVEDEGGKQQAFPLEWFPALQAASDEDRTDWTQTDKGLHFNKLGIDVAIRRFENLKIASSSNLQINTSSN